MIAEVASCAAIVRVHVPNAPVRPRASSGAIPILFLSIGSVAPGLIVGLVSRIEDGKEGKGGNVDATGVNRRVRHEAAHFLVGWLLGLPIADYSVEDQTSLVEFHPTQNGELQPGQRLAKGEVDKMCVVALSGAVGEALHFDSAFGGGQDLQTLQRLFLMSEERINAQQQQDQVAAALHPCGSNAEA